MSNILFFAFICVNVFRNVYSQSCTTAEEWLGDNMNRTSSLNCYAYQCCANTTTTSTTGALCNGAKSCIYSSMDINALLECGGYLGCAYSNDIDSYAVSFFIFFLVVNCFGYGLLICNFFCLCGVDSKQQESSIAW